MTQVTKLLATLRYRFFPSFASDSLRMTSPLFRRLRRLAIWATLDLALFTGALALSTSADTRGQFRKTDAGDCYCGCAHSKTSIGCARMCEPPKYASRTWAVTCTKPRVTPPAETPGAGPHYPHKPRAERASN
jgi:hypothetical protein